MRSGPKKSMQRQEYAGENNRRFMRCSESMGKIEIVLCFFSNLSVCNEGCRSCENRKDSSFRACDHSPSNELFALRKDEKIRVNLLYWVRGRFRWIRRQSFPDVPRVIVEQHRDNGFSFSCRRCIRLTEPISRLAILCLIDVPYHALHVTILCSLNHLWANCFLNKY